MAVSEDLIQVIDAGIEGYQGFEQIRKDGTDKIFPNILRLALELVPAVKVAVEGADQVPQALLNALKSRDQIEEILSHVESKVGKPDSRVGKLVRRAAVAVGSGAAFFADAQALLKEFQSGAASQSLSAVSSSEQPSGGQDQGESGVKAASGGSGLTADVAARFAEQQKTHKS